MDEETFKKELLALYLKAGFYVSACGCCDSPYVNKVEDINDNDLNWKKVKTSEEYLSKLIKSMVVE